MSENQNDDSQREASVGRLMSQATAELWRPEIKKRVACDTVYEDQVGRGKRLLVGFF
jgi:hypothetical protein